VVFGKWKGGRRARSVTCVGPRRFVNTVESAGGAGGQALGAVVLWDGADLGASDFYAQDAHRQDIVDLGLK